MERTAVGIVGGGQLGRMLIKAEVTVGPRGVAQKQPMACGLACVSFVTGEPYDRICLGEPSTKLEQTGFTCPELVSKLAQQGQKYGWKKLAETERDSLFHVGDIVFVARSEALPEGHFLAKSSVGWMDPWINLDSARPLISEAVAGFREALPGQAEYLIYKIADQS